MSNWSLVWKAYMQECKRINIFKEIFKTLPLRHNALLAISGILFLIMAISAIFLQFFIKPPFKQLSIYIMAFFEVVFLFSFSQAKSVYIKSKYSQLDIANTPPEENGHQSLRYLKFRETVKESGIKAEDVDNLLDILDTREKLEDNKSYYSRKLKNFLATMAIALIISLIKSYEFNQLIIPAIIGVVISFFVWTIASIIPSPSEKISELRYFLTIFQKENNNIVHNK